MRMILGDHKGQLCLVTEWANQSNIPEQDRLYYPTGIISEPYKDLLGKEAIPYGSLCYTIGTGLSTTEVRLLDGGKTKPVFREVRPVKKPRWGVSYANGEWKRY